MKLYRINALMLRNWYISLSNIDRLFDVLFWPIVNLFIWGFTAVFIEQLAAEKGFVIGLFVGALMLWFLFDRAQKDMSLFLLEDFWERSVYYMYVSPMKDSEFLVSVAIWGFVRAIIEFAILVILALVFYGFNIIGLGLVKLTFFIIPLLIFGWAVGVMISGLIFIFGSRVSILTWSLPFLLQPVAAIYYPVAILPEFLRWIAYAVPLSHIFEGFRAALDGAFAMDYFVIATVLSVAYLVLGCVLFYAAVRRSKRTGFLAKQ